jgi:hypothetical protein
VLAETPRRRWRGSSRRRLDWFELCVLAVLAAISVWVLGLDVRHVAVQHLIWTGTDGLFLVDHMQYRAWIRDASRHVLVSDLFVLRSTPHDYFQPEIAISGAVTRLGLSPSVSLLLWKPVGVLSVFLAVRTYCAALLPDRFDRRAALVLALFFGFLGIVGDEWIPFWSWGYPFGLIGIGALAAGLVAYARDRARGRVGWKAPVLGIVASFSHPWQGELMILIILGTELALWRSEKPLRDRVRLPAITMIATALPLLYFETLYRSDRVWRMAQAASRHTYSLKALVLPLVPLLICAIPALLRRPRGFIETATRMWLLATLFVYAISSSGIAGTPLHAFAGITIPLAVLAVEGVERLGFRRLPGWRIAAVVLIALATIPAARRELSLAKWYSEPPRGSPNFIARGDQRAIEYLAKNPEPGGVLTSGYLGMLIPGKTGRHTYVGDCLWSEPDCRGRQINEWNLFRGFYSPRLARAFVRSTHARFVLAQCNSRGNLSQALGPLVQSTARFGCATVYTLVRS